MPLKIHIPAAEYYDSSLSLFINIAETDLELEHSLYAISKWEEIWKKPFLSREDKTKSETYSYINCMILNESYDKKIVYALNGEMYKKILDYIEDRHTATTFNDRKGGAHNRDIITAEIIYYWMFSNGIPLECEHWNFDKLMTLLRVFAIKNSAPTKMSKKDILSQKYALNNRRLGIK